MPFGARTIPSRRSVLTCNPAFPGGRASFGPPPCPPPTSDSKGSRFATLGSLSAAGALFADLAGFVGFGAAFFAAFFGAAGLGDAGFATAAGLVGPADALEPDLAGACAVGLACGGAALLVATGAEVLPVPLAGLACACRPQAPAASIIPSSRVFTKRIIRSFPFRVSPPVSRRPSQARWS